MPNALFPPLLSLISGLNSMLSGIFLSCVGVAFIECTEFSDSVYVVGDVVRFAQRVNISGEVTLYDRSMDRRWRAVRHWSRVVQA